MFISKEKTSSLIETRSNWFLKSGNESIFDDSEKVYNTPDLGRRTD